MRVRLSIVIGLLAAAAAAPAHAAVDFAPCAAKSPVECATLDVPLDPSGVVAGSVRLAVTRVSPTVPSRGVVFMLAGGPGQASAGVLRYEGEDDDGSLSAFTGYTIVAVDPRGTGGSGVLACDFTSTSVSLFDLSRTCFDRFGAARFVSTRTNAADLEAVRQALGAPRVVVVGTSYGTVLAQAYARLYPTAVDRLVLDSVAPLAHPDLFSGASLRAIPRALDALCAGRCAASVGDELVRVANALPSAGVKWSVDDGAGRAHVVYVTPDVLVQLALATDLDVGIAAELPAAVGAYEHGDVRLLARLVGIAEGVAIAHAASPYTADTSALVLTTCNDLQTPPWSTEMPLEQREQAVRDVSNALAPDALGGFGTWAARSLFPSICLRWDVLPDAGTTAALPPPDVPVLALSGTLDVRTPTETARAVVGEYPRGRLLLLPGLGHAVLGRSACARSSVAAWLADAAVPASCPAIRPALPFVPLPATRAPKTHADIRRAVDATVADAAALYSSSTLDDFRSKLSFGGLRSGRLTLSSTHYWVLLSNDEFAPGVYVSGSLSSDGIRPDGRVRLVGFVSGCGPGKARFHGAVGADGTTRLTFGTPKRPTQTCP